MLFGRVPKVGTLLFYSPNWYYLILRFCDNIPIMDNIRKLCAQELEAVDNILNELLSVKKDKIYDELRCFFNAPQKRIRSLIASLYIKALGHRTTDIIDILVIGELIHNASLLHDDVLDDAFERRGLQTLGSKFSSKVAILSGDLLLSMATKKLICINNWKIIEIFQECIEKMCNAELKQYFLRGDMASTNVYLKIAEGKTASLFEAVITSSALITSCPENQARSFAQKFGVYFQLKNDLETISAESDAKNKIYTLKDILGLEKTKVLMDNYLEEIRRELTVIPENQYKNAIEDMLRLL